MSVTNKPWASGSKSNTTTKASPVATSTAKTSLGGSSGGKNRTLLDIRAVETKRGVVPKLQLAKGVELYFEGQKVDLGEYNSAFLKNREEMEADLTFLVEKEYMTPEQADERVAFLNDKNITAQLTVKL
jgi:hypothetical protein